MARRATKAPGKKPPPEPDRDYKKQDQSKLNNALFGDDRLTHDADVKLDTGMAVVDAVRQAAVWYEKTGRKELRQLRMKGNKGANFANATDPDDPNFLTSGIQRGDPWDRLTRDEKLRVTQTWHHHFVRLPQQRDALDRLAQQEAERWCWYHADNGHRVEAVADEDLPSGSTRPMCEACFRQRYPEEFKLYEEHGLPGVDGHPTRH